MDQETYHLCWCSAGRHEGKKNRNKKKGSTTDRRTWHLQITYVLSTENSAHRTGAACFETVVRWRTPAIGARCRTHFCKTEMSVSFRIRCMRLKYDVKEVKRRSWSEEKRKKRGGPKKEKKNARSNRKPSRGSKPTKQNNHPNRLKSSQNKPKTQINNASLETMAIIVPGKGC